MTFAPTKEIEATSPWGQAAVVARAQHLHGLVDDLLHDARNPLNAMAINIELLAERLRREGQGSPAASHEKSLQALRDQIARVDSILREFSGFLAPRPLEGPVDLAALVRKALAIAKHRLLSKRLTVDSQLPQLLEVRQTGAVPLHDLALLPLLWAIARSPSGGRVEIALRAQENLARLSVADEGTALIEEQDPTLMALKALCQAHEGGLLVRASGVELSLPLS